MRINHNIIAMNTYSRLTAANTMLSKSLEKLSSGMRINRAGDDAAGLAISEKMRGQIRGLQQAARNAQDTISLIQTAEGALNETHAILQRIRELAVQAANDTNAGEERAAIGAEIAQLKEEINRIASQTQFNNQNLLNGSFVSKTFQIGANTSQTITLSISTMTTTKLNIDTVTIVSTTTATSITQMISAIDTAINTVSAERSKLGAVQNRLEHTIANLDTAVENLQAAESRIRDVDMAKEMMEFTKYTILQQAATAMLAQANQTPQAVLQLLR